MHLEVLDGHLNSKRLILLDLLEVDREREFGRRNPVLRWYDAHWRGVAATAGDLLTIGNGKVDGSANIDEVVGGGQTG